MPGDKILGHTLMKVVGTDLIKCCMAVMGASHERKRHREKNSNKMLSAS